MEWSTENIMEFLELLQTQPCLWDPRQKSFKNRSAQNDAWRRIVHSLSFPVSVEDLKKKKESLMGYYRIHVNKYKKSLKSGNEVYTTNWFAYDIMHSFLEPIYASDNVLYSESRLTPSPVQQAEAVAVPVQPVCPSPTPSSSLQVQNVSSQPKKRLRSPEQNYNHPAPCIKKLPLGISSAKKQMDEAFCHLKLLSNKTQEHDEYYHFALMIAAKIRKINDFEERETLMNTIQNIVYETLIKNKNNCSKHSPWHRYSHRPVESSHYSIEVQDSLNASEGNYNQINQIGDIKQEFPISDSTESTGEL